MKITRRIFLISFAVALLYLFCTPIGALRLAVFPWAAEMAVSLHLQDAFDRERQEQLQKQETAFTKVYRFSFEQAPRRNVTENPMLTWHVYRIGPLCWASYQGEM